MAVSLKGDQEIFISGPVDGYVKNL